MVFTDPEFPKEQSCKRVIENGLINKNRLSKLHFDYWDQLKAWKIKLNSGYVWVEGDNSLNSVDSRHYGPIPRNLIEGKVVCRFAPKFWSFQFL